MTGWEEELSFASIILFILLIPSQDFRCSEGDGDCWELGVRSSDSWRDEANRAEPADAENPAMTLQLTIDISWRRVSDPDRWALRLGV